MKILLDCDGIMADFVGATLRALKSELHLTFTPEDVTQYDVCKALRLTADDTAHLKCLWRAPGFAASVAPYPEALAGVEALKGFGEVVVVTAPMKGSLTWAGEREAWLERHFGLTEVISTREKHHVSGDVLIDDMTENLLTSQASTPVLFRRPWNANDRLLNLHTVATWPELVDLVDALTTLKRIRGAA